MFLFVVNTQAKIRYSVYHSICKDLKAFFPTDNCSNTYRHPVYIQLLQGSNLLFLFLRLKNENIFYSF